MSNQQNDQYREALYESLLERREQESREVVLKDQVRDNLFRANHRNAMLNRYGWTDAMRISLDDLYFEATLEQEWRDRLFA